MTYDQWCEKFRPKQNHIDPHAGFDGCTFETFGEEVAHVREVLGESHEFV